MIKRTPAVATELVHNNVVVTRYEFAPNAETGWHQHSMDYVVVALSDCQMLIEDIAGPKTVNEHRAW